MSAPIAPTIPPRPNRNQDLKNLGPSANLPTIPPRPANRRADRSVSPGRDNFARSPLNETPSASNLGRSTSSLSLPRPPSVTLPSLGQEGSEYAEIENMASAEEDNTNAATPAAEQTRQIADDLHLHAPKPSLPKSSAKAQVQTVTRTDSGTAAALGYGKPPSPNHDDMEPLSRRTSHVSRPESTTSTQRRQSIQLEDETGIPEIGQRVPMYPNAGDVQAPSPAPNQMSSSGIGFHNNGAQRPRQHSRAKSSRDAFTGPPGSYGLHGHGIEPTHKFEKAWYDKHPEAKEEHGHYGPGLSGPRNEYTLSSDDLNKIVRNTSKTASSSSNLATTVAYPDEEIGYMATEEFASRMASPNPTTSTARSGRHRTSSVPSVESPLRQTSFPPGSLEGNTVKKEKYSKSPDHALESESEDHIHIEDPVRRPSRSGQGFYGSSTDDLDDGAQFEDTGEHGYSILPPDEADNNGDFMQPAVTPAQDRRDNSVFFLPEGEATKSGSQTPSISGSRPSSRPESAAAGLARYAPRNDDREDMHTPLENVEEYEPLFPDGDHEKPMTAADRFKKRPGALKRRFPSQDIWEDTPHSHHHYATVSTPELPKPTESTKPTFETSEAEATRKSGGQEEEKPSLLPKHVREEMKRTRPSAQRFPSRDIWEDSPDSHHLVTTVSTPEVEESKAAPPTNKPTIPARPARAKASEPAAESGAPSVPQIPTRRPKRTPQVPPTESPLETDVKPAEKQTSPTEGKKAPVIPDRPKPQVPARPAKPKGAESPEELTKTLSAGMSDTAKDATPPPAPKAKPSIPARPAGSKIAALQAGFMSDLNKRLQVGPKPVEKEKAREPETEVEKAPLSDARKGRARGPARRKPAQEASPEKAAAKVPQITISMPRVIWSIDEEGDLDVAEDKSELKKVEFETQQKHPAVVEPPLATNTAGEAVEPASVPDKTESKTEEADSKEPPNTSTSETSKPESNVGNNPSTASSGPSFDKTADQTPGDEIEDPMTKVPTATPPDADPDPDEAEPASATTSNEAAETLGEKRAELERQPSANLSRESSLGAGLGVTLSGQKVDAHKASDALETLDQGTPIGGGGEAETQKSEDEIKKMSHRGSVTVAETGDLRRKSSVSK